MTSIPQSLVSFFFSELLWLFNALAAPAGTPLALLYRPLSLALAMSSDMLTTQEWAQLKS